MNKKIEQSNNQSVPTFRDFLKVNTKNPGYEGLLSIDALRDPDWVGDCVESLAQALRKNCGHSDFWEAFKVLVKKYEKLKARP